MTAPQPAFRHERDGMPRRGIEVDGVLVARERKRRGFSQASFAAEFGFSTKVIKDIEANPRRRVQPQTLTAIAAALGLEPQTLAADGAPPRLLTSAEEILATNLAIVRTAEHVICTTGSRSRDATYLAAIESAIAKSPCVGYFRILFDTPATPEILRHLRRTLVLRKSPGKARRSVSIAVFDHTEAYPAELGICLNERTALFVLPSVHGAWRYDTAVVFEDPKVVTGWVRWIEEMYRMGEPIKSKADLDRYGKAHS